MYWVSSGISSDSINHFTLPTIDMVTREDLNGDGSESKNSDTAGDTPMTLTTLATLRTDLASIQQSPEFSIVEVSDSAQLVSFIKTLVIVTVENRGRPRVRRRCNSKENKPMYVYHFAV